jgi:RNA polymerase sigma factor (sigma-70 family)
VNPAGVAASQHGRRSAATATVPGVHAESPEAILLHSALSGDGAAWAVIVQEHSRLLWWIARSHRLDEATAADVVQTVWLQLIRFGHRIEHPERLGAWLATTARREALRRASTVEQPTSRFSDDADRLAAPPEESVLDDGAIGAALAAFVELPEEDQRLLQLLCAVPKKSYQEIAALLGRPIGAIGPSRQRALDRLRVIMERMGLS